MLMSEERRAKIEKIEAELKVRGTKAIEEIKAAVVALGHTLDPKDGLLRVDGVYTDFQCSPDYHRGWSCYPTGRLRIKVGGYGRVTQFPEPKTGFNAEKIAAEIHHIVEGGKAKAKREGEARERKANNDVIAKRLREEFGLEEYAGPIQVDYTTGEMKLKVQMTIDEDEARQILKLLKEMELI